MKYLGKPFIQDHKGLFYVDNENIDPKPFYFNEVTSNFDYRRAFYHINGVDDYIVKDTKRLPLFFNQTRTKKILRNFMEKQNSFKDIDFPVGYYLNNGKIEGTVITNYTGANSVKVLTNVYKFENLKEFYNHEDDDFRNLVHLCLEILRLIREMFDGDIVYTDINSGNFLVYNNSVKVVDFEPDYVHFTKNKNRYLKLLLSNYNLLVNYILRHYKFYDLPYYSPGESFYEAENRVKYLIKERK